MLADFGPHPESHITGVSNWDFAIVRDPLTEQVVDNLVGLLYNDVYAAFETTKQAFPEYNVFTSNCQHWVTRLRKEVEGLL